MFLIGWETNLHSTGSNLLPYRNMVQFAVSSGCHEVGFKRTNWGEMKLYGQTEESKKIPQDKDLMGLLEKYAKMKKVELAGITLRLRLRVLPRPPAPAGTRPRSRTNRKRCSFSSCYFYKIKSPPEGWTFYFVELAGIEPASEDLRCMLLQAYSAYLILSSSTPPTGSSLDQLKSCFARAVLSTDAR